MLVLFEPGCCPLLVFRMLLDPTGTKTTGLVQRFSSVGSGPLWCLNDGVAPHDDTLILFSAGFLSGLYLCSQLGLPAGPQHPSVQQQLPGRGPRRPEAPDPGLHPAQPDGSPARKQVGEGLTDHRGDQKIYRSLLDLRSALVSHVQRVNRSKDGP